MNICLPSLNTFTPQDKDLRNEISLIIKSVFDSADPDRAVKKYLSLQNGIIKAGDQLIDRDKYEKIYLIAIGKASIPMIQCSGFYPGR